MLIWGSAPRPKRLIPVFPNLRKGQSPFQADREHLHHISLRLGLSSRESLAFISALACIFACIGIIGEYLLVPDVIMLLLFLLLFAAYLYLLQHIWRIISHFRHKRQHNQRPRAIK